MTTKNQTSIYTNARTRLLVANFGCKIIVDVPLAEFVRNLYELPSLDMNLRGKERSTDQKRNVVAHHKLHRIRKR